MLLHTDHFRKGRASVASDAVSTLLSLFDLPTLCSGGAGRRSTRVWYRLKRFPRVWAIGSIPSISLREGLGKGFESLTDEFHATTAGLKRLEEGFDQFEGDRITERIASLERKVEALERGRN